MISPDQSPIKLIDNMESPFSQFRSSRKVIFDDDDVKNIKKVFFNQLI